MGARNLAETLPLSSSLCSGVGEGLQSYSFFALSDNIRGGAVVADLTARGGEVPSPAPLASRPFSNHPITPLPCLGPAAPSPAPPHLGAVRGADRQSPDRRSQQLGSRCVRPPLPASHLSFPGHRRHKSRVGGRLGSPAPGRRSPLPRAHARLCSSGDSHWRSGRWEAVDSSPAGSPELPTRPGEGETGRAGLAQGQLHPGECSLTSHRLPLRHPLH